VGQIFIKSAAFLNIQYCIVTVHVSYRERCLSLLSELKFANFCEFSKGKWKGCGVAKPILR